MPPGISRARRGAHRPEGRLAVRRRRRRRRTATRPAPRRRAVADDATLVFVIDILGHRRSSPPPRPIDTGRVSPNDRMTSRATSQSTTRGFRSRRGSSASSSRCSRPRPASPRTRSSRPCRAIARSTRTRATTPTSSASSSATRTTSANSACRSRRSRSPGQAGNNQNLRYRIPRGRVRSARRHHVLARRRPRCSISPPMVWREGSLSGESRRAIIKLRSLGVTADEPVIGYAPRVRVRDAAFEPLSAALAKHAVVRFSLPQAGRGRGPRAHRGPARARPAPGPLAPVRRGAAGRARANVPAARIVSGDRDRPARPSRTPAGDRRSAHSPNSRRSGLAHTAVVEVEPGTDAATRLGKRRGTRQSRARSTWSCTTPTSTSSPTSSPATAPRCSSSPRR